MDYQVTKLCISLSDVEEDKLVSLLSKNFALLAREPSDMHEIDTRVVCYRIAIESTIRPVS